jgi:hypothetical protein
VRVHLEGAHLDTLSLKGFDLNSALLHRANIAFTDLDGANLAAARLDGARVNTCGAKGAKAAGAYFTDAHCSYFSLAGSDLTRAHLDGGSLTDSNLSDCNFTGADFSRRDLRRSRFAGARLRGASFDGADVRQAAGLEFDENSVNGMRIEADAPDRWSVLRRKYTGPWFFIYMLLFGVFLLPYLGKIGLYLAGSAAQDAVEQRLRRGYDAMPRDKQAEMDAYAEWFRENYRKERVVWVLLGVTEGAWHLLMSFTLIAYNCIRGYLTLRVSVLRDTEERARISPARSDFMGDLPPASDDPNRARSQRWPLWRLRPNLWALHRTASILLVFSAASFLARAFQWLVLTKVYVRIE